MSNYEQDREDSAVYYDAEREEFERLIRRAERYVNRSKLIATSRNEVLGETSDTRYYTTRFGRMVKVRTIYETWWPDMRGAR